MEKKQNPFFNILGYSTARVVANKILNDDVLGESIYTLAYRWKDEQEYEDWQIYKDAVKKMLSEAYPTVLMLNMSKPAFGRCFPITISFRDTSCTKIHFDLIVKGNNVTLKSRMNAKV